MTKCNQQCKEAPCMGGESCVTLMPVLVASLTASSSLSYFGLNVTVKAQSIIRPETPKSLVIHNSLYEVFIL